MTCGLYFVKAHLWYTILQMGFFYQRRPVMKRLAFVILLLCLAGYSQAVEKRYSVPVGDSPALGGADAPVTIIEFLDFQ